MMKLLCKTLISAFILSSVVWGQTPVQRFARAIAKAEGFGVKGAKPTRNHSPGDIRVPVGMKLPGQIGRDRFGYAIFRKDVYGWAALEHQLDKVAEGTSAHYTVNDSLRMFARRYATSPLWLKNVSKNLGVQSGTELWEIFDVAPVLIIEKGDDDEGSITCVVAEASSSSRKSYQCS